MRAVPLLTALLALAASAGTLSAQQFEANYADVFGRPDDLIVCGAPDTATYRLSLATSQPMARDIEVTVQLFAGMRAVGFDATRSSAGVSLVSLADPTRPVISVPDLTPGPGRQADFALILEARCGALDTISNHDPGLGPIDFADRLSVRYTDLGGNTRTELETIDPYIAAIAAPLFTVRDSLPGEPFRAGERLTRFNKISNGSFRGYADTVLYEFRQGRDVAIGAIRINGTDRAFAKTPLPGGDTLVSLVLAGADFAGNTVGGGPGNGDARFDPSEVLVVEEDLLLLRCGNGRLSSHTVRFGCDGEYCGEDVNPSLVRVGSGQPNLEIRRRGGPFPDVEVGYCQEGELTVEVVNAGRETDPTFGEARNIAVSAVFSDIGAMLANNGYLISGVSVSGVRISDLALQMRLDTIPGFGVDPDGAGVGLEDLDGDGAFDDLAVGEVFEMKVFYALDCADLSADGLDENCANDAFTTVQTFAYYDDACGVRLSGGDFNLYSPRNVQDEWEQFTQPDAFAEGAPFQIELEFGRLVFNFANSCSGPAELRAYVELPPGVSIDAGTSAMSRGGGAPMPVKSVTPTPEGAVIAFDQTGEAFLTGEYSLVLGLSADCSAPLGETIFPTRVAYYCPDCACEHTWICEDIVGPWIHKTAPPCDVADLYPCPQGVQGASFQIDRTTFGFADQGFLTPFATPNTKVAIPADSVRILMTGIAGDNVVTDDLGVILHYFTPNDEVDTAGLFLLGSGLLEWNDAGTWRSCRIGATAHTMENDTTETWQRFDLSACLTDNGWAVQPGDDIRFTGMFEINPEGPILDSYEFVEDLRGGFFALDAAGTETQCDQFGDTFRVGKPLTTFGIPSNGDYPKGCDPAELNFRITSVNRGWVEEFGLEYRRAPRLDSIVLTYDPALLTAYDDVSVQLYVAAHPTEGSNFYDVPPLTDFPAGRYVLALDSLDYSAELATNYTYLYNLRVNLTPNCSSIRSSSAGDEVYPIEATPYYRDRYYAVDISDGRRVVDFTDDFPFPMRYSEPAVLDLDAKQDPFLQLLSDTATVRFEICNSSSESRAGRSWLTFDDTARVVVELAELVDDPLAPVALAIEPYAGGHYVNLEGLERVNGINTREQVCNQVRLRVRTVGCGLSALRLATGWACEAAVPAGWTPAQDQACIDDIDLVTFEPIAPFLEADLIDEPGSAVDLCTPVTMEFQVNNAGNGRAADVLSRFYVPEGLDYVVGSAEVEYPAVDNADDFQPVVTDLVATDTTVRGFGYELPDLAATHPFLGANGLRGFDADSPSDSNRFVIRLTFETTCDYRSGSIVFFETEGTEACGDPTNSALAESTALQINGATPDGSHAYAVGFAPDVRLSTSQPTSTLEAFAQNVGTDPADADDYLEVMLPAGFAYVAGSSVAVEPAGYTPGDPNVAVVGGVSTLEWPMPAGLAPGEVFRVRFDVSTAGVACGDMADAGISAIRYMTALCVSQGTNCRIRTDITQGGGQVVSIPIGDLFAATFLQNTAVCETATAEFVTLSVRLDAGGFILDGTSPVDAALYFDADGDGEAGPGDQLLDQQRLPTAAGATSVVYGFGGSLDRNLLGGLVLYIDDTGLPLCAPQHIAVDLPRLDNAGATDLVNVCVSDDPTLAIGDADCGGTLDLAFQWTTEPAGFETLLDDAFAAAPTVTFPDPYGGPDTIRYILATTRIGLGTTRDTLTVAVSPGTQLLDGIEEVIDYGASVVLTPNIVSGVGPFTYAWSPATGLDDVTAGQPVASPLFTQLYTVTVTDALGCTGTAQQLVTVRNPVIPTATTRDTTICPDADLLLEIGGGSEVSWAAGSANPALGGLSATTGTPVVFAPQGGVGEYLFDVTVSDPAYPGYDSTITIRIVSDPNAGCRARCVFPELVSEVTTASSCDEPTGTIALDLYDAAGYDYAWIDEAGDTIARDVTALTGLSPGRYELFASDPNDTICMASSFHYVNGEGAPTAQAATADATCGQSDGSATLSPAGLTYTWPDGVTAEQRSDLAAGTYRVGVADPADPACRRFLAVVIGEGDGLVVTAAVDQAATCGGLDGAATLTVTGGSGAYDFGWSVNAATNTRLPAGPHRVTVTDRVTGCTGEVAFVLPSNVPQATTVITAATGESCVAARDGSIAFGVTFDAAFAAPADTVITGPRGDTVLNGNLGVGVYCVTITDAAGCVAGGACAELSAATPIRLDVETDPACGVDNGVVRITVREAATALSFAFSDGRVTTALRSEGFAPGPHDLTATDSLGCSVATGFAVGQCPPCDYLGAAAGDTTLVQAPCDGTADVCISGIADRADDLLVYANDTVYTGDLSPCDYGRTRITYLVGVLDFTVPFEVRWGVDGAAATDTVASVGELLAFAQRVDPAGGWGYDATTLTLVGGQREGRYAPLELRRLGSTLVTTVPYNERIEPYGLAIALAPGYYDIVVLDTVANCADTLRAEVFCSPTDTIRLVIPVTTTDSFCVSAVDLPGGIATLSDLCIDTTYATYVAISDTCVAVTGNAIGEQQACYVACDAAGFCDTTIVLIEVVPDTAALVWRDTVVVNTGDALCLQASDLGLVEGPFTIVNTCAAASGGSVDFFVDEAAACIEYDGLAPGEESACLTFCDAAGNCVAGELIVTVIPESKTIIRRTIFINQTDTVCLDTVTRIASTRVFRSPDSLVEVSLPIAEECVAFRGLVLGTDTLGFEVERTDGTVFQACIVIEVVPYDGNAEARPDALCTPRNTPVRVNVLANDQVFGGVGEFEIVSGPLPSTGSVVVNSDNTITFTPARDVCARDAVITYRVCNPLPESCSEATVTICIECDELTVFTAVSPNGDGVNDFFHIEQIEDFPDNHVRIYNRWGNLVYETEGYANDWAGTFDGDPLPDGAYFYIVDVTDGDRGPATYRGYLEIMR